MTNMMRIPAIAIALCIAALCVAGCANSSAAKKEPSRDASKPIKIGTLNVPEASLRGGGGSDAPNSDAPSSDAGGASPDAANSDAATRGARPDTRRLQAEPISTAGGTSDEDGIAEMQRLRDKHSNQFIKLDYRAFSEADERAIGRASARQLASQYPIVAANHPVTKYIRTLGAILVESSNRPDIPYTFIVIETDMVNAFATPYGYIFITTGILKAMRSEAELAFVIAHEINHVVLKHGLQQLSTQAPDILKRMQREQAFAEAKKDGFERSEYAKSIEQQMDAISDLFMKGKGRGHETEADVQGLDVLRRVGYSPKGAIDFFDRLEKMGGGGSKIKLTQSHAPPAERRAVVRKWIARKGSRGVIESARYARIVGNLQ